MLFIYADMENLLEKNRHFWLQLLVIHCLLIVPLMYQKNHNYYRGKDCMKKFCTDLRKHATKIIDCEQKKRNDVIDK